MKNQNGCAELSFIWIAAALVLILIAAVLTSEWGISTFRKNDAITGKLKQAEIFRQMEDAGIASISRGVAYHGLPGSNSNEMMRVIMKSGFVCTFEVDKYSIPGPDYTKWIYVLTNGSYAGRDLLNVPWDYDNFTKMIEADVTLAIQQQQCN